MKEVAIQGGDMGYVAEVDLGEGVGVIAGTGTNQVKLPTADGQPVIGVTLYAARAGEQVTVRRLGIAKAQTSGALARGAKVMVAAATGAFKVAAAATGVQVEVAGQMEEANASDDVIGALFLTPGAHLVGA
jgi:hypothetical protein